MESGVEFGACDNLFATRLTLHILSAIAEHERRMISERTTQALMAAKARGAKLGSARPGQWKGREHVRLQILERSRAVALEAYRDLAPRLLELREQGLGGDRIAKLLMAEHVPARRGLHWTGTQVLRILARLDQVEK